MKKLSVFIFCFFTLITHSQKISLEELLNININDLNEESFQKNWVNKYGLIYIANSGHCHISTSSNKLNQNIKLVHFSFDKSPQVNINLTVKEFGHTNNYQDWLSLNSNTYETFLKKYGKPKDFSVSKDLNVLASWIIGEQKLTFMAKTSIKNYNSNSFCTISLHKIDDVRKNHKRQIELPPTYFEFVRERISQLAKNYIPITTLQANSISNKIKAVAPKVVNRKAAEAYYYPIDKNSYPAVFTQGLNFHNSFIMRQPINEFPRKDGYYIGNYFVNGSIQKIEKIEILNGKAKTTYTADYWYENNIAPKLIKVKHDLHYESYWFDYDEKGLISRVLTFNYDKLTICSIYKVEDKYKKHSCIEFDPKGRVLSYSLLNDKISLYSRKYSNTYKGYNYIGSPYNSIFKDIEFKEGKLRPFLPNILPKDNFKPTRAVDNKIISLAQPIFKNFLQFKDDYLKQSKALMLTQANYPNEIFKSKEYSLCEVLRYTTNKFPLILTQTGKGAVRVYSTNKKTYTLKLNDIFQDKFQLAEVTKTSCVFKNIRTGQKVTLNLKKALNLGKAAYIRQAGRIHKVNDGDTFFGYNVSFENDSIVFSNGVIKVKPTLKWFALTPQNLNGDPHKISDCNCYNDTSFNKKKKEAPQDKAFKQVLNAQENNDAKESKIDLNYLFRFCALEINVYHENEKIENITPPIKVGSLVIANDKIVPLTSFTKSYKVTYFNKSLRINNKRFEVRKYPYQSSYKAHLSLDKSAVVSFTPRNSQTLSRTIESFTFYKKNTKNENYSTYKFKDRNIYTMENKKQVVTPFVYSVDPDKDQMTIDGIIYKIEFREGTIYLISDLDQATHKLNKYDSIPF